MNLTAKLIKSARVLIVIGIGMIVACCAAVTEQTTTPDNKQIYAIDCSGYAVPMSRCYQKAQQVCPMGYTIVANEAPTQPPIDTPINMISSAIAYSIPGVKKGITVECL